MRLRPCAAMRSDPSAPAHRDEQMVSMTTTAKRHAPHTLWATFNGSGKGENTRRGFGTPAFFLFTQPRP